MNDLIEAFTIFAKYSEEKRPLHCERDMLCVGVDPKEVSREDKIRLNDLGFLCDGSSWCFYSFRFGSHGVYGL